MDEDSRDHLERRCPRLGGSVTFQYCMDCGDEELPCFKIFDCWWEYFDIVTYLQKKLSEDQFKRLAISKPRPKVASLVDLIRQARS
ncbi:MAG: hypothetical protein DRI57_13020 [Deltaproteobacteria bacterium]|nr:MAG: hypothetical protein DRI57_13020 [Deltaproteobacteria bacterium]